MQIGQATPAIVTGGASGLGLAATRALAAAGVPVAIFDVNEEAGAAVAADVGGTFCKVDVTSETSVLEGFHQARAAHGQERILVHCAMVSALGKTISWDKAAGQYKRLPTEMVERSMLGVAVASYRLASIAALGMATVEGLGEDQERGSIVLTSSAASQDGQIGQVPYGAAKAAVNGMLLPMARDLMDLGIRVNAIVPGTFATPPMLGVKDRNPGLFEELERAVPFPKRLGKPEEFASLALELIRNTYFNAQAVRLDGAIRMPPK